MLQKLYELEQAVPGATVALPVAGLSAAVIVAALGWPWRRPGRARTTLAWALGPGLGLALGYLAGCLAADVSPVSPKWPDYQRLLFILLPAVILIESLAAFPRIPRPLVWVARVVLAASVARVILHRRWPYEGGPDNPGWDTTEGLMWLGALGAALAVVWVALALLARRAPGRSVPAALAVVCAGAGVTIICAHYAAGGGPVLMLACALAGAFIGSLPLVKPEGSQAAVGVGLVGVFSLLVATRFFADLTTVQAALLLFAPLLGWVPELPGLRRLPGWLRGVLRVALVAVPVVLTVLAAYHAYEGNEPAPESDLYGRAPPVVARDG